MKLIHNILKIADIHSSKLSANLKTFLNKGKETFQDVEQDEDIYNIRLIIEELEDTVTGVKHIVSNSVFKELKKIERHIDKADCAYIRITTI